MRHVLKDEARAGKRLFESLDSYTQRPKIEVVNSYVMVTIVEKTVRKVSRTVKGK